MKRTAQVKWHGGLKRGKGFLSTESGELRDLTFNYGQRFEDDHGTNPEELIGAEAAFRRFDARGKTLQPYVHGLFESRLTDE